MKFCVISPAVGLEDYATRSDIHLLLPQVRNRTYNSFYKKRRAAGDFIILDNGAYEDQLISQARFEKCIEMYKPQVIVCPDALLRESKITVDLTRKFLDRYSHQFKGLVQFMAVPQAPPGDMQSWYKCCRTFLEDIRIQWIGLPRAMATIYNGAYHDIRAITAMIVKDLRPDIKLHALGMANGSLKELNRLVKCGCVESCDSSAPVWRGWNGCVVDSSEVWDSVGSPVNFSAEEPKKEERKLIDYNLNMVFNICSQEVNG